MTVPWRMVTCRKCLSPVQVLELPTLFLDPRTFIGGCCLKPKLRPVPYNEFPAGY